jgi:hypothetical protein
VNQLREEEGRFVLRDTWRLILLSGTGAHVAHGKPRETENLFFKDHFF